VYITVKIEEHRVSGVKTAILFPFRLSLPSRCRRLTRPSPEKGKAATQTQGTRATTPHPRSQAIKKPAGGGEAEGGGGNRKRSERRASLLACPNPQSPSSLSRHRWTSSSISSSARPGELPPRAVPPSVSSAAPGFGCSGFGSGSRRAGSGDLCWGGWTGAAAWGWLARSELYGPGSRIGFTGGSLRVGLETAKIEVDSCLVLGLRVMVVVVCVYEGLAIRFLRPQGGRSLVLLQVSEIRMVW